MSTSLLARVTFAAWRDFAGPDKLTGGMADCPICEHPVEEHNVTTLPTEIDCLICAERMGTGQVVCYRRSER